MELWENGLESSIFFVTDEGYLVKSCIIGSSINIIRILEIMYIFLMLNSITNYKGSSNMNTFFFNAKKWELVVALFLNCVPI